MEERTLTLTHSIEVVPRRGNISISTGAVVEALMQTNRDDLEIIGFLWDYVSNPTDKQKQKVAITKQIRKFNHEWVVNFYNADADLAEITVNILCVRKFI